MRSKLGIENPSVPKIWEIYRNVSVKNMDYQKSKLVDTLGSYREHEDMPTMMINLRTTVTSYLRESYSNSISLQQRTAFGECVRRHRLFYLGRSTA